MSKQATPIRWKPAVTVAAVIERDGRFLMVEEDTSDGVRLNQPAGHLEPGETLPAGAMRETLEESGHALQPQGLLGVYLVGPQAFGDGTGSESYLRFAFVGTVGEPVPGHVLDAGIRRALWLTADEVRAQSDRLRGPVVLRCIEDYLTARSANRPWAGLDTLHALLSVQEGWHV